MNSINGESRLDSRAKRIRGALNWAKPTTVAYRVVGLTELVIAPALLAINQFATPILSEGDIHSGGSLIFGTLAAWAFNELNLAIRKFQANEILDDAEKVMRGHKNLGTGRRV